MGRVNLLVVEDAMILSMLGDPRFIALLPCLADGNTALDSIPKKCGRCNRKQADTRKTIMSSLKNCVASARGSTLAKLKDLMNARQLRIKRTTGTLTL